VTPGKRFFQYDYRMRLIAEDAFGNDVPFRRSRFRTASRARSKGGDTTQGRESVVRLAAHLDSLDLAGARRHDRHSRSGGGRRLARSKIAIRAATCCRPLPGVLFAWPHRRTLISV
jgi:hypothetical protein